MVHRMRNEEVLLLVRGTIKRRHVNGHVYPTERMQTELISERKGRSDRAAESWS